MTLEEFIIIALKDSCRDLRALVKDLAKFTDIPFTEYAVNQTIVANEAAIKLLNQSPDKLKLPLDVEI